MVDGANLLYDQSLDIDSGHWSSQFFREVVPNAHRPHKWEIVVRKNSGV